jgi:NitT/TauT family transport system substrate-binding protein
MISTPTAAPEATCGHARPRTKGSFSWLAMSLALCAALVLYAAISPAHAQSLQPLSFTVGVGTVPSTALVEMTARELGLWEKHGLQPVTPPPLGGGDRRSWNAAEENHSDVRLYGLGAAINYMSKGVDFVVVADLGMSAEWHMWSLADAPIKPQDVRGKRIAVTQLSGTDRLYADLFLKSLGIAQNDVTFVPTGGLPQNYQALLNKQADVWVTTSHAAALLDRERRLGSIVTLSSFVGKDWDPYVILAKRETLQRDPKLVIRGVATLLEAADRIAASSSQENRERLMRRFKVDEPTAERLLATVAFENPSGRVRVPVIEKMRQHYIDQGIIRADAIALARIYDESIVDRVRPPRPR